MSRSVDSFYNEWKEINHRIVLNQRENINLKNRKRELEKELNKSLEQSEMEKYKDYTLAIPKPKTKRQSQKQKQIKTIDFLQRAGIRDPNGFYEALMKYQKPEKEDKKQ